MIKWFQSTMLMSTVQFMNIKNNLFFLKIPRCFSHAWYFYFYLFFFELSYKTKKEDNITYPQFEEHIDHFYNQ